MRNAPPKLIEAWLRFHQEDLCQGVDAVFVFNDRGMEVWSRVEDEKNYQKFQEMVESLRHSYTIDFYTNQAVEKKSDNDPPASLWENYELRSYLGDPYARYKENPAFENNSPFERPPVDEMLKQRLLIYAEQTLGWNKKMERYARDIPQLVREAYDPSLSPELRRLARAVCLAHVQNMGKCIGKLQSNLSLALPKSEKNARATQADKPDKATKSPLDLAEQMASSAGAVCLRVYRFIHPEHYTVALGELREPSLLESLKRLDRTIADFQNALGRSGRN